MPSWIDFKQLRALLDFEEVLAHYGVEIKRRGEQHVGYCPLPTHQGKRSSPSFSANLERGIFHCFGCQAQGNILDFAVLMAREDPRDGRALKKVAVELRAKFLSQDRKQPAAKFDASEAEESPQQLEMEPVVNEPLDFELQGLDPTHPYLAERGFVKATIMQFGLGYCARGSLAGRIAIPLHDVNGSLIGYAGRVVDEEAISEENPKYRFPAKREREGRLLEFRKDAFLYNGYRFKSPTDNLVVVEEFSSVWWLHQQGFPRAVATMGAECSDAQIKLIVSLVKSDGHVWVLPAGGELGEKFALSLITRLSPERFVRWVKLEKGSQPTRLSTHQLKRSLLI